MACFVILFAVAPLAIWRNARLLTNAGQRHFRSGGGPDDCDLALCIDGRRCPFAARVCGTCPSAVKILRAVHLRPEIRHTHLLSERCNLLRHCRERGVLFQLQLTATQNRYSAMLSLDQAASRSPCTPISVLVTCMMIRLPPAEPSARTARPSRSKTIVGDIEDKGRFPPQRGWPLALRLFQARK